MMINKIAKKVFPLLLVFNLGVATVFAQDPAGGGGASGAADQLVEETLNDLIIVTSSGFAGAILGLSTLSFYEHPSDHMRNVIVGGATGIIIGVGIVAFTRATKSRETFYEGADWRGHSANDGLFASMDRMRWHNKIHSELNSWTDKPQLLFTTSF